MAKKQSKASKDKPLPKKLKKEHYMYILYAAIILIFLINFSVNKVQSEEYEWHGFWDDCFGSNCNDCRDCSGENCGDCGDDCCVNEVEDETSTVNNSTANVTVTPASTPNCSESVSVQSSSSGDIWEYSFSVTSCSSQSLDVYLKGRNAQTLYLYNGHQMSEWGFIGGSGERAARENYTEVCVELGSTDECS